MVNHTSFFQEQITEKRDKKAGKSQATKKENMRTRKTNFPLEP